MTHMSRSETVLGVECEAAGRVLVAPTSGLDQHRHLRREVPTVSVSLPPAKRLVTPEVARSHLLSRIRKHRGCWLWQGWIDPGGYGHATIESRPWLAHRASYEAFVGEIPQGMELDHLCRRRRCINPEHLEPVTSRENTLRSTAPTARNAEKTHCDHGHLFDEANTYLRSVGGRQCRACGRAASQRYLARKAGRRR